MTENKTSSSFTLGKLFSNAWQVFKKKWQFIVGISILVMVANWIPGFLQNQLRGSFLVLFIVIGGWILNLLIQMGSARIFIKLADHKKATWEDLWQFEPGHVVQFFLGTILMLIIVSLGVIFFILPGIYLALKYAFVPYLIVDKKLGPLQALEASSHLTEGIKWSLLGLMLVMMVLNFLGVLALGLGLIITMPVTYLAYATAYNQLKSRAK